MRCLYCGNKLSLLRRIADGKFCSDAHREAHQRLQDELALTRLADTRSGRSGQQPAAQKRAAARAAGLPPHAPLLPQAAVWIDCRRVVPLPLEPPVFSPDRFLPESCLRAVIRGFPAASAAPLQTAVPPEAGAGTLLKLLPVAPLPPESILPLESRQPAADPVAPPQPLIPLAVGYCRPAGLPALETRALHRRKLVIIVPKSGLDLQTGRFTPAPAVHETFEPRPARSPEAGPARGAPAALVPQSGQLLPAPPLSLDPPDWVRPAVPASDEAEVRLEQPSEPPLQAALLPLTPPPPVSAPGRVHATVFSSLSSSGEALLPVDSRAPAILAASPRLQPQAGLESLALAPLPAAVSAVAAACGFLDSPELELPRLRLAASLRPAAWPALAGLTAVNSPPARCAAAPCAIFPLPAQVPPPEAPSPAVSRTLPLRQLRSVHHLLPAGLPAPAALPPALAAPSLEPAWAIASAASPPLSLDLQPPEPLCPAPEPLEHVPDEGLHALGRAVAAGDLDPGPVLDLASLQPELSAPAPAEEVAGISPAPPSEPLQPAPEPPVDLCGRLPMMPVRPVDSAAKSALAASPSVRSCWATLDDLRPAHPSLRLELDHADGSGPRRHADKRTSRKKPARPLGKSRFWAHAPSDLKWIAVALPLLLVVVVYSFNANKPNNPAGDSAMASTATAPAASESGQPWIKANAVQRFIMRRAGVRLFDDFRGGLGAWQGNDGWAKTWRYGDATFVQPGDLALLSSSLGLSDYTLTFLGQIERRSLNWVFRAKDLNNYYSMRIAVTRTGPLPEAVLVRTVVLNGREREVKTLPIPFPVQADTLYLVRMEVRGHDFTTYIQDQIVDHFTDTRLKSGGVGFYSPRGDRALLRWVEVSHQYDYLGRLCALLSPYGVQGLPAD